MCRVSLRLVPDLPDLRDHVYAAPRLSLVNALLRVDLCEQLPAVCDRGKIRNRLLVSDQASVEATAAGYARAA